MRIAMVASLMLTLGALALPQQSLERLEEVALDDGTAWKLKP
jgi:hypothetical protein